jgi:hypothetical protein
MSIAGASSSPRNTHWCGNANSFFEPLPRPSSSSRSFETISRSLISMSVTSSTSPSQMTPSHRNSCRAVLRTSPGETPSIASATDSAMTTGFTRWTP